MALTLNFNFLCGEVKFCNAEFFSETDSFGIFVCFAQNVKFYFNLRVDFDLNFTAI